MALTQEQVDTAPARDTWISDGHGLILRTSSRGGKSWYRQFNDHGRPKRVKIGDAAEMSLYEARELVRGKGQRARERVRMLEDRVTVLATENDQLQRQVLMLEAQNLSLIGAHNDMIRTLTRLGLTPKRGPLPMQESDAIFDAAMAEDPIDPKWPERMNDYGEIAPAAGPTFAHYADTWIERNRGAWSEGSLGLYQSKLRVHLLPAFGHLPVSGITTRMLADLANGLTNGTRAHVLVAIRGVMDMALAEGACDDVAGRRLNALIVREKVEVTPRPALDVEDAPAFYAGIPDTAAGAALKLIMLTAVRIKAVAGGDVAEVEGDVWTVPEARQSASKRTPRVPLVPEALRYVDALGTKQAEIRKLVAGVPGVSVHGMRATFRSWCQHQAGFSFEAKEIALGHAVGTKVQRAYERDDLLDERRRLMQAWADYLTAERKTAGN